MSDPVLKLLQDNNLSFTVSGKDYLIKCLNPLHEDTHPSCRVDKVSGITHCFSCGFKRNLFKHFGIFDNNISLKTAALKEKLHSLLTSSTSVEMPPNSSPYNESFRGISLDTLRTFGAFKVVGDRLLEDRILFPIIDISGKVIVYQGRHILSDVKPKYVFYPGSRTPPCYPSIMPKNTTSIFLVEGIFDMLNLYDKGVYNVSCTFGTQTILSNITDKLLPFKAQGIRKIFILFDGDTPGKSAAETLKPLIETCSFDCEIITLEDGSDPGDLNQDQVNSLKEYT